MLVSAGVVVPVATIDKKLEERVTFPVGSVTVIPVVANAAVPGRIGVNVSRATENVPELTDNEKLLMTTEPGVLVLIAASALDTPTTLLELTVSNVGSYTIVT
jgi:hypothetical protein